MLKRTLTKQSAKTARRLELLISGMAGTYGDLQGIVGRSLPGLHGIGVPRNDASKTTERPATSNSCRAFNRAIDCPLGAHAGPDYAWRGKNRDAQTQIVEPQSLEPSCNCAFLLAVRLVGGSRTESNF